MKILKITFTLAVITFLASCQKELSMEVENATLSAGTWEFQESAMKYGGKVYLSLLENTGRTKTLTISGKSLTGVENFLITLYTEDNFKEGGTYSASISEADFIYS